MQALEARMVVIDCIPKVKPEKLPKLEKVLKKVMEKFGEVLGINVPVDPATGQTGGFCFVEFSNKAAALEASNLGNGYKLDKKHIFAITLMSEFNKYINTPEEWRAPSEDEFEDKANPHWWLTNKHCEDQLVLRHETECEVAWCRKASVSVVKSQKNWSDADPTAPVEWSPNGTYLVTFHRPGIVLSHGKTWTKKRFPHSGVRQIQISPSETHLVTYSRDMRPSKEDPQQIIIWNIATGEKVRGFNAEPCTPDGGAWPAFKWSSDDTYFSRMKHGEAIAYYATADKCKMTKSLNAKKEYKQVSMKIPGLENMAWSPSDNYVAFWSPEEGERPARVTVIKVSTIQKKVGKETHTVLQREEVTSKNLFQVKDVKLVWQKNGDKLCVYVQRWTKSKKQWYTQFLLFRLRNKLVPCDVLDMKDKIEHFAWEPTGSKFAIIHEAGGKTDCSIFKMEDGKVTKTKVYERVEANALYWSPTGRHLVIAGMGTIQGSFMFVDTDDMDAREMATGSHVNASELMWDPTGRYVATVVSAYQGLQHDTGYMIWSFQGKALQRQQKTKFYLLAWRPRPLSLLTKKQIVAIEKGGYKVYEPRFVAEDAVVSTRADAETIEKRDKMMKQWSGYVREAQEAVARRADRLAELRPMVEDAGEEVEQIVEVFVREDKVVVSADDF